MTGDSLECFYPSPRFFCRYNPMELVEAADLLGIQMDDLQVCEIFPLMQCCSVVCG